MSEGAVRGPQVREALQRVAERLVALRDTLNALDAALGDGDCGLTMARGGTALSAYLAANPAAQDLGRYLAGAGAAFNREAPSTLGTVVATMLLRAGAEARGKEALDAGTLARMLRAADAGVQQRGGVKPGDKTVVDVLHPAAEAFAAAIESGASLRAAAQALLEAARRGRDASTPLASRKGRGAWVGERSMNKLDPGAAMLVEAIEAVLRPGSAPTGV